MSNLKSLIYPHKHYRRGDEEQRAGHTYSQAEICFSLSIMQMFFFPFCLVFPLYFPERKGVQGKHITQNELETERK